MVVREESLVKTFRLSKRGTFYWTESTWKGGDGLVWDRKMVLGTRRTSLGVMTSSDFRDVTHPRGGLEVVFRGGRSKRSRA